MSLKEKDNEKCDRNLRISQIHHKRKEGLDKNLGISQIHHKKKEGLDKNLGISQIHHKRKAINFSRILSIISIILLTGPNLVYPSMAVETEEYISTGNIYYVTKNGNDNNPGTETRPWLTITKAANTVVAGDTVYIKSGTYKERLLPKNSGSTGKYITFTAYPGNSVTIDGNGISVPIRSGLVLVSGKNYINIIGLRIINSGWAGIYVTSSSHINLKNNYVYNTRSSGILMSYGNNYVIDGNEVALGSNDKTGDSRIQEIISLHSVNIFDVKNNYVHDGGKPQYGGEGIDIKDGSSNGKVHHNRVYNVVRTGIYIDAWDKIQKNIEAFSNIVSRTGHTGIGLSGETGGTLDNISVYNNVVYEVPGVGIHIPESNPTGYAHLNNVKIFNNVVYRNGYGSTYPEGGIWIGQWANTYINGLIVKNNIVSQNNKYQIRYTPNTKHTGINIDKNLIDGYRGFYQEVRGTNYIEGDPLFLDSIQKNFRLKGASPAIDKGTSNGAPSFDFDGISRPKGSGYDIGSFEHVPSTSIVVTSPNGGENWRRNTAHTISWTYTGNPGTYVKIELLKGGIFNKLISSSTQNDGSYSWTVQSTQTLGSDYKIRITSTSNSIYKDISNNNFIVSS